MIVFDSFGASSRNTCRVFDEVVSFLHRRRISQTRIESVANFDVLGNAVATVGDGEEYSMIVADGNPLRPFARRLTSRRGRPTMSYAAECRVEAAMSLYC